MIKSREETRFRPIEIDLSGPDGNVFILIATAKRLAKQIFDKSEPELLEAQSHENMLRDMGLDYGVSPKTMGDLIAGEMVSGDYEHAVRTFDKYFGNLVILYR